MYVAGVRANMQRLMLSEGAQVVEVERQREVEKERGFTECDWVGSNVEGKGPCRGGGGFERSGERYERRGRGKGTGSRRGIDEEESEERGGVKYSDGIVW